MELTYINIEDISSRGIDVLIHTAFYNQEPDIRVTSSGKKEYIIKKVRNNYISLKARQSQLSEEEAPLPYYASNNRDAIQLCEKHSVNWSLNYVSKSSLYLASVENINYVYKTASGALIRAVLIHQLKKKFGDSIKLTYKVLDRYIEL
jgi:hypothetical protein